MPYITLVERVVERCNDTRSRNYMKVVKMTKRVIDTYYSCNPTIIPRIGEVVYLNKQKAYDVLDVIYSKRKYNGIWHDEVILEVKPHVCEHSYNSGSYSFKEDWPIIMDLEDEQEDEQE